MVTRNVVLTETQDQLVQALVASGRYQNVSEAMRAGLRLLEREEAQIAGLRDGLLEGLQQAERGDLPASRIEQQPPQRRQGSGERARRRRDAAPRGRRRSPFFDGGEHGHQAGNAPV